MKSTTHTFSWYKIISGIVITLGTIGYSFLQSTFAQDCPGSLCLNFNGVSPVLVSSSFPISFGGGGNQFAGTLIISEIKATTPININYPGQQTIICTKQVNGYYFNAARGIGLVPIQSSNGALKVRGGLYTACNGTLINEIIGTVDYHIGNSRPASGGNLGTIVFGTDLTNSNKEYNTYNNIYKPGAVTWQSAGGGQLKVNGEFFDTMLGIGNISSTLNTPSSGTDVTDLIGKFNDIYIQGHVGIGQSVESLERKILTTTLAGTKTLLNSSDEIVASTVINTVEKNRAKQCRNSSGGNKKFICISEETLHIIDDHTVDDYINKDVVFEQGDVFIDESAYTILKDKSLSIYIANGNLIFDSDIDSNITTPVDKNGFKTQGAGSSKGIYLLGNYIVNGIVLGAKDQDSANQKKYTTIPLKTFIHGKLTSLNTFTSVSPKRITLLQNILNNPSYEELINNESLHDYFSDGKWNASMESIFSWRCDYLNTREGIVALGSFGELTKEIAKQTTCPSDIEKYPLSIIERDIPTLFFNK